VPAPSRRHHQLSSKHPRQHTYRPKSSAMGDLQYITKKPPRHQTKHVCSRYKTHRQPEVITQNAIKTLRYLKGFPGTKSIILLKDLSCVAMSMPMPIRENRQYYKSHDHIGSTSAPICQRSLLRTLLPWTHALAELRPGSIVQAFFAFAMY
jgi:hypothetical protein